MDDTTTTTTTDDGDAAQVSPRPDCCDDPRPRILEKNGRQFCANCRRYLDKPSSRQDLEEAAQA